MTLAFVLRRCRRLLNVLFRRRRVLAVLYNCGSLLYIGSNDTRVRAITLAHDEKQTNHVNGALCISLFSVNPRPAFPIISFLAVFSFIISVHRV